MKDYLILKMLEWDQRYKNITAPPSLLTPTAHKMQRDSPKDCKVWKGCGDAELEVRKAAGVVSGGGRGHPGQEVSLEETHGSETLHTKIWSVCW